MPDSRTSPAAPSTESHLPTGTVTAHEGGGAPWERIVGVGVTVVLLVVVAYPLVWLILSSLGLPGALDLAAYSRLFTDLDSFEALLNTILLAVFSGLLAGFLGIPLAWLTVRSDLPGRRFLPVGAAITYMIPPYLAAVAYIILGAPQAGLLNRAYQALTGGDGALLNIYSLPGTVLVVGLSSFPIAYFLAVAAFSAVDGSYEQAARVLGASRWKTFRSVTLPIVAPATTAGVMVAAVGSLAMFGPQRFLGNPGNVPFLPTRLFAQMQQYPPLVTDAATLAVALAALTILGLFIQQRLLRRGSFVTVSGKGTAADITKLGRWRWVMGGYAGLVIVLAVLLPVGVLIVAAFSQNWLDPFSLSNLTLANFYEVLFDESVTQRGIRNSLLLASGAATAALGLGFVIAYLDVRRQSRLGRYLDYLAVIPLGLPGIVMGLGLLQGWVRLPLPVYGTAWILLIAYLARNLPYSVRSSNSSIRQVDPALEEAAQASGASWGRSLRDITAPLITNGLLVAWMLVFIPAMGELSATILLYSHGAETISVAVFRLQELGRIELVAAMALIFIIIVLATLTVVQRAAKGNLLQVFGSSET